MSVRAPIALLLPIALIACSKAPSDEQNLDSLDAELTNTADAGKPAKDPALMSALQSQIMVDPALAQQSNAEAVRPADQPYAGQVPADGIADDGQAPATGPLMKAPAATADCPQCDVARQAVTLGGLAARQRYPGTAQCVGGMRYSAGWATRLPADVPLYPRARLTEAAGNAAGGCALRAATFTTAAPLQTVLDWYYTRTAGAGYASEHQARGAEHVLGGNRERDGAAYVIFARSRDDGATEVDLIVNNGR